MGGAILDAGRMEGRGAIDCDVVVVGSGSGGGAAAARLAEAGLDVVVLEEGGHYTSADFTRGVAESLARLYRDGGSSVIFGRPNLFFQEGRCVGGSTVINGGMAWRTPEPVLARWRRDHGLDFMTPEGMEPYFRAVDESIHAAPQHPDSISPGDRLFRDSAESLGIPVTPNRRSQVECRGSNVCILGCPDNRKQAVHVTYIPRQPGERAQGIRIVVAERLPACFPGGAKGIRRRFVDADGLVDLADRHAQIGGHRRLVFEIAGHRFVCPSQHGTIQQRSRDVGETDPGTQLIEQPRRRAIVVQTGQLTTLFLDDALPHQMHVDVFQHRPLECHHLFQIGLSVLGDGALLLRLAQAVQADQQAENHGQQTGRRCQQPDPMPADELARQVTPGLRYRTNRLAIEKATDIRGQVLYRGIALCPVRVGGAQHDMVQFIAQRSLQRPLRMIAMGNQFLQLP